jgi:hypothetical protein
MAANKSCCLLHPDATIKDPNKILRINTRQCALA